MFKSKAKKSPDIILKNKDKMNRYIHLQEEIPIRPGSIAEALLIRQRRATHSHAHNPFFLKRENPENPLPQPIALTPQEREEIKRTLNSAREKFSHRCVTNIPGYITVASSYDKGLKSPKFESQYELLRAALATL